VPRDIGLSETGGAGNLKRTRFRREFPDRAGIQRPLCGLAEPGKSEKVSIIQRLSRIPGATEHGIVSAEQGIVRILRGTLACSSVNFNDLRARMCEMVQPISVHETLKTAIRKRCCVVMMAEGRRREVCPHALGYKDKRLKLLVYQYSGASASGLANDGAWRCFFFDDIWWTEIASGPWHSSPDYVAKAETSFDHIECLVPPLIHSSRDGD
jgi:hypothetical protein